MIRAFLKVYSVHYIPDSDGLNCKHEVATTTSLGCLTSTDLHKYVQTLNNTNFNIENSCISKVKTSINPQQSGDIHLNIEITPWIKNGVCGAKHKEDCPLAIITGKCKNPQIIELMGKKFFSKQY